MNDRVKTEKLLRFVWASAITASAGALMLVFLHDPAMPLGVQLFSLAACLTAVAAWRSILPKVRANTNLLLFVTLVFFAGVKIARWISGPPYANRSVASQNIASKTPERLAFEARYNALEKAILSRNIAYVRSALAAYPDVNTAPASEAGAQEEGSAFLETPLETAVKTGNQPITLLLLEHGNSTATENSLTLAVDRGDVAMLHVLIERGHLPHPLGEFAKEAMFRAVELGDYDAVALLMLAGESRNTDGYCAKYGSLPISLQQLARREGRAPIVQLVGASGDK